jgi:hypothetical protein
MTQKLYKLKEELFKIATRLKDIAPQGNETAFYLLMTARQLIIDSAAVGGWEKTEEIVEIKNGDQ